MVIVSVLAIVATVFVAIMCAALLSGRSRHCAVRSSAAAAQLSVISTVVLYFFYMAEQSVIVDSLSYKEAQYKAENIDLNFMNAAGAFLLIAVTLVAVVCLVLRLMDAKIKPWISFAVTGGVSLVAGVVTMILLSRSAVYEQYKNLLLPILPVLSFTCIFVSVNTFLSAEVLWQRIVLIAVDAVNAVIAAAAVVWLMIMTNTVLAGAEVTAGGVVIMTVGVLLVAGPAAVSGISLGRELKGIIKPKRKKRR